MIEPYSDSYMYYDEKTGHYVLTAKAVLDNLGIDLGAAIKDNANGVNAFLIRVSNSVYRKIHEYNTENKVQDKLIAHTESGRDIVFRAMLEQFFYMKQVGDLSLSIRPEERALYCSDMAIEILQEPIPEIGRSVLYSGAI